MMSSTVREFNNLESTSHSTIVSNTSRSPQTQDPPAPVILGSLITTLAKGSSTLHPVMFTTHQLAQPSTTAMAKRYSLLPLKASATATSGSPMLSHGHLPASTHTREVADSSSLSPSECSTVTRMTPLQPQLPLLNLQVVEAHQVAQAQVVVPAGSRPLHRKIQTRTGLESTMTSSSSAGQSGSASPCSLTSSLICQQLPPSLE